jgi:lactate permease
MKLNFFGEAHTLNFFNPGFAFVLAVIFSAFFYKTNSKVLVKSLNGVLRILILPFIAILFLTALVQIMILSGNNLSGLDSMIQIIASLVNNVNISFLPFISTIVGAFGAFIAGSATVSNILFGNFQYLAASNSGFNISLILALQLVGAGIGNMIALTNIVAAQATVKLHGKESEILKINIFPMIIYISIATLIGIILLKIM